MCGWVAGLAGLIAGARNNFTVWGDNHGTNRHLTPNGGGGGLFKGGVHMTNEWHGVSCLLGDQLPSDFPFGARPCMAGPWKKTPQRATGSPR